MRCFLEDLPKDTLVVGMPLEFFTSCILAAAPMSGEQG